MTRTPLPSLRAGLCRDVEVGGAVFTLSVSFYPEGPRAGQLGEVFLHFAKGGTLGGLLDALSTTTSIALQSGTVWAQISAHLKDQKYPPADDKFASISDAVARTVDDLVEIHSRRTS